jgi:type IV secretion system protein VirB6
MNEAAPIAWLLSEIDSLLTSNVTNIASSLASQATSLLGAGILIYVVVIAMHHLLGNSEELLSDLFSKLVKFGVLFAVIGGYGQYTNFIRPTIESFANYFLTGVNGSNGTATAMDYLVNQYADIADKLLLIMSGNSLPSGNTPPSNSIFSLPKIPDFSLIIRAGLNFVLLIIGCVPFVVACCVTIVIAKIGMSLVLTVGPLFVACAMFPATRAWFNAWLNAVVSYALIPLFVSVVCGLGLGIAQKIFPENMDLENTSFVFFGFAGICNWVLLITLRQVGPLAAQLSAGGINIGSAGGISSLAEKIGGRGSVGRVVGSAAVSSGVGAYKAGAWAVNKYKNSNSGGSISKNRPG